MTYPNPPIPDSLPPSLRIRKRPLEWLEVVGCVVSIVVGTGIAVTLQFGPDKLHDTPAVQLIAALDAWGILAGLFAVHALLLLRHETRVFGWLLGVILYAYYLTSLLHAVATGSTVSVLALGATAITVTSQITGLIRSTSAAEWRASE